MRVLHSLFVAATIPSGHETYTYPPFCAFVVASEEEKEEAANVTFEERDDNKTYKPPPPLVALQSVNFVVSGRESLEFSPTVAYNPPPYELAVQVEKVHPERVKSVEEGMERRSAPPSPLLDVELKERPLSVTSDGQMETSSTPGSEVLVPVIEEKLVEVTERTERV